MLANGFKARNKGDDMRSIGIRSATGLSKGHLNRAIQGRFRQREVHGQRALGGEVGPLLPGSRARLVATARAATPERELRRLADARDERATSDARSAYALTLPADAPNRCFTFAATAGQVYGTGTTIPITWNVAGTDANGINTATVDILYSSDNGATVPTVLAAATPNERVTYSAAKYSPANVRCRKLFTPNCSPPEPM